MKVRVADIAADGVALGAGVVAVLNLADWMLRGAAGRSRLNEAVGLALSSWLVRLIYFGAKRFAVPIAVGVAAIVVLRIWRPTRSFGKCVAAALAGLSTAWLATLSAAFACMFAPRAALLLYVVSAAVAGWLARRSRWPVTAMMGIAAGVATGVFCAQLTSLPFAVIQPPAYGFLPPVLVSCVASWMIARRCPAEPVPVGRWLLRCWGICAACLCATLLAGIEVYHFRARAPEPPAERIVSDWSYDVYLAGQPPALLWTTREHLYVLADAYEDARSRSALADSAVMVERIWRSTRGDFYVQANRKIGWWRPVPDGQVIPPQPTAWLTEDGWFPDVASSSTVSTFAEDPQTRRFMAITEWLSQYAFVDPDGKTVRANGKLSNAVWPWWWITMDPSARVAFASSGFDDGGLYEFGIDAADLRRSAKDLYLYETVLEPASGVLWGVRPISGELLGVDTRTLAVQSRIPVEVGVRDVQIDPESGDLFTCSFLSGNIFRIDRQTRVATKLGWCGRLARNLYLDARRRTLWVATADGICRLPIDH